ncbi:hypothetical protein J2T13_002716 [Paenibacillus sp. DS2015]|uniref:hypothetical protein n=1 Tax=Paenibacillus sp. DS2015 TaxID=3373917 RepID=UPI003D1BFA18
MKRMLGLIVFILLFSSINISQVGAATRTFKLDKNTAASLKVGKIPGFDIQLGMKKAQVVKVLGNPKQSYNWIGGQFWIFNKVSYAGFCFNEPGMKSGKLYAVSIGSEGFPNKTFAKVKAQLGKPSYIGEDEAEGGYTLMYEYGGLVIYFAADTLSGKITKIDIINKDLM